jgi:hypothetical protein
MNAEPSEIWMMGLTLIPMNQNPSNVNFVSLLLYARVYARG